MKKEKPLIIAASIAVIMALGLGLRVTLERMQFQKTVRESYETSEGYDKKFINMVNRLEDVLAGRAQFGYRGGKDPMTGNVRQVQKAPTVKKAGGGTKKGAAKPKDRMRLTATFFDPETKGYTAIVMDGERSVTVEVGDHIGNRRVRRIGKNNIVLESKKALYRLFISGVVQTKPK